MSAHQSHNNEDGCCFVNRAVQMIVPRLSYHYPCIRLCELVCGKHFHDVHASLLELMLHFQQLDTLQGPDPKCDRPPAPPNKTFGKLVSRKNP